MRTRPLICAALGAALLGPPPGLAQSPAAQSPAAQSPAASADDHATALSGVTVVARRATPVSGVAVVAPACPRARKADDQPPRLVSTFPAKGATVRPGLLILRLTFDKPMTCDGLLLADLPNLNPCPSPLEDPLFSRDRRTFLTVCRISRAQRYGLQLQGFRSLTGHGVDPGELAFTTSDGAPVASVDEALGQDRWLADLVRDTAAGP